jgi:hypothetical protein
MTDKNTTATRKPKKTYEKPAVTHVESTGGNVPCPQGDDAHYGTGPVVK